MRATEQGPPDAAPTLQDPGEPEHYGLRWLRLSAIVVVVLTVGTAAIFGSRIGGDPTLINTPLIGTPAPNTTVPFLEKNDTMSLKDLRGRIVVVNFWASWCLACRKEHPSLMAAASAYRKAGVAFVGVVYQDRTSSAVAFLDELGRGKGYRYVTDPQSRLAIDFGVFGVPETFFVDQKGTIVAKITGASTLPMLSGVLDDILAGRNPNAYTKKGSVKQKGSVKPSPSR